MAQTQQDRAVAGARVGMWIAGSLFALVAIGCAVMLVPDVRASVMPPADQGMVVFAIIAPTFAAGSVLFFAVARSYAGPPRWLETQGRPGRAVVREVKAARFALQSQNSTYSRSTLVLDVQLDGQAPYTVEHATFVPLSGYPRLRPGTSLPVRVHPSKPGVLLVLWDQP